jgi:DNA processing protein
VVEAAKRSGSLITARLALEQNRDVFAVPGSPLDPRAEGANHLIQQGAKLVTSAADIIDSLAEADPSRRQVLEPDWEPDFGDAEAAFPDMPPSPDERGRLIEALSPTPIEVDALIAGTGLSAAAIQMLLFELDLAGRLEWSAGQLVALKG